LWLGYAVHTDHVSESDGMFRTLLRECGNAGGQKQHERETTAQIDAIHLALSSHAIAVQ
jgi:hypothetical protein